MNDFIKEKEISDWKFLAVTAMLFLKGPFCFVLYELDLLAGMAALSYCRSLTTGFSYWRWFLDSYNSLKND